jgi:hypothetical protein
VIRRETENGMADTVVMKQCVARSGKDDSALLDREARGRWKKLALVAEG